MEQTTEAQYMTREFLESMLVENKNRIRQLEEAHATIVQRDYSTKAALQTIRDEMQRWTFEALESGSITETEAEEISNIVGFELYKEVEVEVTVTYNITLNVSPNEDAESIVNDIDFDSISYNSDHVCYMSSTVDRIDFQWWATKNKRT